MTGTDTVREFHRIIGGKDGAHGPNTLHAMALKALDDWERDAIAWVREHGGMVAVKRHWSGRVALSHVRNMAERHKAKVARMQSHIEHVQGVCKTRAHRIVELNKAIADMRPRLMPEGMEWPRFEDNEPVRVGDEFMGKDGKTYTVKQVQLIGKFYALYDFCDARPQFVASYGERVKRPAPKVLDADGAEIRVGDTVWTIKDARELEVIGLYTEQSSCPVKVKEHKNGAYIFSGIDPDQITHRAPVLAADGRPLREGETVWDEGSGDRLIVGAIEDGGHTITCRYADLGDSAIPTHGSWSPCNLTHERPDSWERLEEDAEKGVCKYFDQSDGCGSCPHYPSECGIDKTRDLVRRARALAERDA